MRVGKLKRRRGCRALERAVAEARRNCESLRASISANRGRLDDGFLLNQRSSKYSNPTVPIPVARRLLFAAKRFRSAHERYMLCPRSSWPHKHGREEREFFIRGMSVISFTERHLYSHRCFGGRVSFVARFACHAKRQTRDYEVQWIPLQERPRCRQEPAKTEE